MEPLRFCWVDVFAETKYAGNPLAVFTSGVDRLSTAEMQQIAREINVSETTFILSPEPRAGGYDVRIFTPTQELPFAGHPTLGTAYVLRQQILRQAIASLTLNLPVGPIPVTFAATDPGEDIVWMQQPPPSFQQVLTPEQILPVLQLEAADLDPRFPIQEVSTGIPFIIVPLRTQAALKRTRIHKERLDELVSQTTAKQILVFCPEPYNPIHHLSARMFADYLGIPEDPATGSANGCLAGYLVAYNYFGSEATQSLHLDSTRTETGGCAPAARGHIPHSGLGASCQAIAIRVEQGHEIGRPSLLYLKAQRQQETIQVSVGGKVILIAQGEFVNP